jgi:hypothetical protein
MVLVEGVLAFNGMLELGFGLLSFIDPENVFCELMLPFSTNSQASHLWATAIVALGIGCLYGAYCTAAHQDGRFAAPILVAMITYHIAIIYTYYLGLTSQIPFGDYEEPLAALAQPEYVRSINLPDFCIAFLRKGYLPAVISDLIPTTIELSPIDFIFQGLGTHISMLLLTLLAFCFCNVDGPLTNAQYQFFLKIHQRQLQQQSQSSQQPQQQPLGQVPQQEQTKLSIKSKSKKND